MGYAINMQMPMESKKNLPLICIDMNTNYYVLPFNSNRVK